jgi:hypothetical protein
MKSIFSGAHDFIDVGALGDLSSHKRVDQLPTGTKHLQILAYANVDKSDSPLLFGTCIDSYGKVLTKTSGSKTTPYQHVLMKLDVVMMSIMNCTYVIFKPLTTSTVDGILVKSKCMGKDQAKIIHDNIGSDSDSSEEQTIASLKKTGAKRQSSKTKQAPKKRIKRVTRSGAN